MVNVKSVISENQVNRLLSDIEKRFPNFVAGIITDRHGFPIATRIPNKRFNIEENELALSAIASNKRFFKGSKLISFKEDLGKSQNIKLLILFERKTLYLNRYKGIQQILKRQDLF